MLWLYMYVSRGVSLPLCDLYTNCDHNLMKSTVNNDFKIHSKQTVYLQKVEAPKVTLEKTILNTIEWTFCASIRKIQVRFLFICIFRQCMFCVQLYEKWACWGCYNLYFEALKGFLLKNVPQFFSDICRKWYATIPEFNYVDLIGGLNLKV